MHAPYFSVIIPTWNRAHLLPRAIDSVLRQNFTDWELIVVNDGSTDGTEELAKEYRSDSRIRMINQENRQLNGARNRGVAEMKGKYGCFLDDDDVYLAGHLSALHDAIESQQESYDLFRSGLVLQRGERQTFAYNYENGTDMLAQYWRWSTNLLGFTFPVEILRRHPFNEAHLLLDDFVWLNTLLSKYSLFQLPSHTVLVHLHPNQRSNTYLDETLLKNNLEQLREAYHYAEVANRVPRALYRSQIVHQHMHFCRKLIRGKNLPTARKVWWRGLQHAGLPDLMDVVKTGIRLLIGR
jgi:glycosyltransferase involved in cell wall biosynthesis